MHRRDVPAARQEPIAAQRLRPLLIYGLPHVAHLALADLAGARMLSRVIDHLLKRPGVGTLVGEAETLPTRLAKERGSAVPGP